jgi:hypothetical protein
VTSKLPLVVAAILVLLGTPSIAGQVANTPNGRKCSVGVKTQDYVMVAVYCKAAAQDYLEWSYSETDENHDIYLDAASTTLQMAADAYALMGETDKAMMLAGDSISAVDDCFIKSRCLKARNSGQKLLTRLRAE